MAERRMFSKSVVSSGRFLRMSEAARLLYYDLGMYTDDGGAVDAFTVMRITGASDEALRELVRRGFVVILNDEMVVYIPDWRENNTIRGDRLKQSVYAELIQTVTGRQPSDNQVTTKWQPTDNQMTAQQNITEHNQTEQNGMFLSSEVDERVSPAEVVDLYHAVCVSLPQVKTISDKRRTAIRRRLSDVGGDLSELRKVFEAVEVSDFLCGRSGKWCCSFDWIMKQENFIKIREGNYANQTKPTGNDYSDVSRYVGTSMDV